MLLFQLWREYKLSISELLHIFQDWKMIYADKDICIFDKINETNIIRIADNLWWIIKIAKLTQDSFEEIAKKNQWKFQYGISAFWKKIDLKKYLIHLKKDLKDQGISSRFVNKDFQNLNSAQIIGESLIKKWSDFSIIHSSILNQDQSRNSLAKNDFLVFQSLWVQDIESYGRRDFWKTRDMQVWMLPPKLCQIMLNISEWKKIYDPFVWLWTLLLESLHMWNTCVYGSDLSEAMVETSRANIKNFISKYAITSHIEKLNAKFVWEFLYLKKVDAIVSEWYLGEVMTQKNISLERIEKQKLSLEKIYIGFFSSLKKAKFSWTIVICFPFWEINKKYVYANNLYAILEQYTNIWAILAEERIPEKLQNFINTSASWSLLYKRKNQLVWREIFKLTIKL